MIDYMHSNGNSIHHAGSLSVAALRLLRKLLQTLAMMLLMGGSSWVAAQQLVDISSCAGLTDDKQRLACYDKQARAAGTLPPTTAATSSASAPAASAPAASAPAASAPPAPVPAATSAAVAAQPSPPVKSPTVPAATGTDPSRIAAFGNASKASIETGKGGQEMLVDTVTAVKNHQQNILQITLSSGQVWRQMIAQRFLLLEGDKIHIVPSPFGNTFRLTVEGRSGFIQVEKLAQK